MAVGAVGAVGSLAYDPYIYNTRQVSSASLNRIGRISDDATDGGVDFSAVEKVEEQVNINPLKRGETANFADVLMSQMNLSQIHQSQLLGSEPAQAQIEDLADEVMQAVEA
ncbi:MAG: hypothetical protein K5673_02925 [Lachnospiraceae bacterium]|nr:hypothetical protein [Lachnospiraceae bacterium]